MFTKCLLLGLFLAEPSWAISFYNDHERGWFWYEEIPSESPLESTPKSPDETKHAPIEAKAMKTLEAYKQQLQGTLALALTDPSPGHVRRYMMQQQDMQRRSEAFARSWQQVVLENPDLNHERIFPTAQFARHAQADAQRRATTERMKALAKTFGLFYFFAGSCHHCQGFSPIVAQFAQKYGFAIVAVSLDGAPNEHFENVTTSPGLVEMLGITSAPTLVAYNSQTQELIPISHAAVGIDRLEENSMVLTQGRENHH